MVDRPKICVAVLAAGQSRRFSDADKLSQDLGGTMLGTHITRTLGALAFAQKLVINAASEHPCANEWRGSGFSIILNPRPSDGLGSSVAYAARAAMETATDALLICLADMPFVPASHIEKLIEAFAGAPEADVVASHNGRSSLPPAIFGAAQFADLAELSGEAGAKQLIARAKVVSISPDLAFDIDTHEALAKAKACLSSRS